MPEQHSLLIPYEPHPLGCYDKNSMEDMHVKIKNVTCPGYYGWSWLKHVSLESEKNNNLSKKTEDFSDWMGFIMEGKNMACLKQSVV